MDDLDARPESVTTLQRTRIACPEPLPPSPGTLPSPEVTGDALHLLDLRGDDRLALPHRAVAWSPDSAHLLVGTRDAVQRWNASTGLLDQTLSFPEEGELRSVPVESFDGKWVAVAVAPLSNRTQTEGWLLSTRGEPPRTVGVVRSAGLRFSTDGLRVSSSTEVWDIATGERVWNAPPHPEWMVGPDGRHGLRSGTGDALELVELQSGSVLLTLPGARLSEGTVFSDDGRRVASLNDRGLTVFDLPSKRLVLDAVDARGASVLRLTRGGRYALTETLLCSELLESSPDRKPMPCASPRTEIWDLDAGTSKWNAPLGGGSRILSNDAQWLWASPLSGSWKLTHVPDLEASTFGVWTVSISPDSTRVLFEDSWGFGLAALDGRTPVPSLSRRPHRVVQSVDGLHQVALGSRGELQLLGPEGCFELGLSVWGPREAGLSRESQLDFSPSGQTLVIVESMNGSRVMAFSTADGSLRWSRVDPHAHSQLAAEAGLVVLQRWRHPLLHRFDMDTGRETSPPWPAARVTWFDQDAQVRAFARRDPQGVEIKRHEGLFVTADGTQLADLSFFAEPNAERPERWFSRWPSLNPNAASDLRVFPTESEPIPDFTREHSPRIVASRDGAIWAVRFGSKVTVVHERLTRDCPQGGRIGTLRFTSRGDRLILTTPFAVRVIDSATCTVLGEARFPDDPPRVLWVSSDEKELQVDTEHGRRARLGVP